MTSVKSTDTLELFFGEKITSALVPELKERIVSVLEQETDYTAVTANFSNVEYIDSTGITLIIGLYKTVKEIDKDFRMTNVREEIKNLLSIIQLDKVFSIE